MPLDSMEFAENPLLVKLGRVERLLATDQQWCKGRLRDVHGRHCLPRRRIAMFCSYFAAPGKP